MCLNKYVEKSDYTQYKCEASNVIGQTEAFVDLLGKITKLLPAYPNMSTYR